MLTRTKRKNENGIRFYSGDVEQLINSIKSEPGKNIYCDGGSEIVHLFMQKNLINEYIISVIPIILGDGKRLFKGNTPTINIKAISSEQFESGLIQLHYAKSQLIGYI